MTRGFSLMELMLALAIGSVLSGIMYMCLFQSQRVANSIENITNIQMRALITRRQIVRDISGAFIPMHILEPKKEKQEKPSSEKELVNDKKEKPKVKDDQKNEPDEKDKNIKERLAKVFDGTAGDIQFKQLLLVTNNPLEVYWSNKAGRPKFRAEKITYRLEQEKKTGTPSYKLIRTTTYPKGSKGKEATQTYELVTGIKKITVSYIAVIEEEEKDGKKSDTNTSKASNVQAQTEKTSTKKEIKTFTDWAVQSMADDDIRLQKKLPDFIAITLELWNSTKATSETFTFTVPIAWQEIKHKPKASQQKPKSEQTASRTQAQQQPKQPIQQMQQRR